jgi:endonuclease YncB( thermonuclease family)
VLDESMNINLEMVTLGLALAATPGEDDPHGPTLIDAEQAAFDARVGLWVRIRCRDHPECR